MHGWIRSSLGMPRQAVPEVRSALSLLTRLPVRATASSRTGSAAFALIGGGLGLVSAVPVLALGDDRRLLSAVLAVGLLALVSGALHLDGLADTADALAAPDPREAERARRDPAIGAVGAVALALVLGLDVAAIATVPASEVVPALVVAGSVSRAVPAIAAPWAPHGAGGFGAWFAAASGRGGAAVAVLTSLAVALLLPGGGPRLGWLAGLAGGLVLLGALGRRFGTVNGDGFGAAVEVAFAASLVALALAP